MNQLDFRKMLTVLACWATAAKNHLDPQAKHGKAPPSPDDARAEIPKAHPIRLSRSPGPYLAKLAMRWKPDQSTSDFLFESSDDPLYRLSCMAQEVLEVSESQWPGGGSEASRDLLALLRPIEEGGGRSATIADLKRIEELVESILDGSFVAKEPLEGPAKALVASVAPVELLPSPPWRNGIGGAVEKCLLVYIAGGKEIAMAALGGTYAKRPDKLAGLVRDEIATAMKSPKNPFVPIEGHVPVGRTAGGIMRITFCDDKNSTKRGRKPRES